MSVTVEAGFYSAMLLALAYAFWKLRDGGEI